MAMRFKLPFAPTLEVLSPGLDCVSGAQTLSANTKAGARAAIGPGGFLSGGSTGAKSHELDLTSGVMAGLLGGDDLIPRFFAADNGVSFLFGSRPAGGGGKPGPIICTVPMPEPA